MWVDGIYDWDWKNFGTVATVARAGPYFCTHNPTIEGMNDNETSGAMADMRDRHPPQHIPTARATGRLLAYDRRISKHINKIEQSPPHWLQIFWCSVSVCDNSNSLTFSSVTASRRGIGISFHVSLSCMSGKSACNVLTNLVECLPDLETEQTSGLSVEPAPGFDVARYCLDKPRSSHSSATHCVPGGKLKKPK